MQTTTPASRYLTLRDYLRVLRRYRVAIVLLAALGTVAGIVDAKRQPRVYQATASVSFQDPAQELTLVGLGPGLVQTPSALAAQNAETLTRPQIMTQVQRQLRSRPSIGSLTGAISGQVTAAGLLQISATSPDRGSASQLANAVARVLVKQNNNATRAVFTSAASDIRRQIKTLRRRQPITSPAGTQLPVYEDELARLDTLSKFAQSTQVAQLAQTPSTPVSSSTVRSGLLGLALGLLLAILMAFLRDSLDRRLRTPHDIEESFQYPILGHVREQAMGTIVRPREDGEDDNALDLEAFRILRRNLEFLNLDSPPRSIVVTSAVPEEGKTTVASSLAVAIASTGRRTLLIDCDLRRPAVAARLGVDKSPGISDFLAGEASPDQILRPIVFSESPSLNGGRGSDGASGDVENHTLVCIPAGSPTSHAAELLGSRRFKAFLEEVVEAYDVVVIDSSPLLPVADTLEILPHADAILVCAREVKTTREQARAAKTALSRFPERPTGVVITGIRARGSEYESYAYSYTEA